jgi:hypothetical protein
MASRYPQRMDALAYNRKRKYSSDTVKQIQRVVGVDATGEWNEATVAGVREFQTDHALDSDGKVGPGTLAMIQQVDALDDDDDHDAEDLELAPAAADSVGSDPEPLGQLREWCGVNRFELVDFRDLGSWPRKKTYPKDYGYPRDKSRADPPKGGVRRDWKEITTFMLHTTAAAGMSAKRGVGMPCHLFLPKEDAVVLCHELELLLYHGHAGNKFSVGLEISGVSAWDNPNQIERAKALLRYFQAQRRRALGENSKCYVMAHRMSHESRVKDPGERIWQDVGEWAIDELGFELGPVVGSGRPVDEWRVKRS